MRISWRESWIVISDSCRSFTMLALGSSCCWAFLVSVTLNDLARRKRKLTRQPKSHPPDACYARRIC